MILTYGRVFYMFYVPFALSLSHKRFFLSHDLWHITQCDELPTAKRVEHKVNRHQPGFLGPAVDDDGDDDDGDVQTRLYAVLFGGGKIFRYSMVVASFV
jgi:hypothetical protein